MNFEPDADPDARRGEDVAAVIHLFARLASFDDTPTGSGRPTPPMTRSPAASSTAAAWNTAAAPKRN
ncbi:hypothetical protein ACFQZ4_50780 [Catellatospora coxensis]